MEEEANKGEMLLIIKNMNMSVDNYRMDGFEFSNPSGFEMHVSEGFLYLQRLSGEEEVYRYPAFSFDLEPDVDLDVAYDVYLLDQPSNSGELIHIDRTELGYDRFPRYEGEDTLLFTLASCILERGLVDLSNSEITVRRVEKKVEDTSQQEVTQPEGETGV